MSGPRAVSMIASSTEIICALGFENSLVGRSHECDYPASVGDLPIVTRPMLNIANKSRQIDSDVKDRLRRALSIYEIDGDRLKELKPDIIVTQSQCEVCAVSVGDVEKAVCEWTGSRPKIVSCEPDDLKGIWGDFQRVAEAFGTPDAGKSLIEKLTKRMEDTATAARALSDRPSVACIEWTDPLMAAGNWVPELVEMAGGRNLFGEAGKHSPWMTWEALRTSDPDVIVVMPCGFDIARVRKEMAPLTAQSGWADLSAVRRGRVFLVDGNQYFNRPGPRVAESLEILVEVLHPRSGKPRFEGPGWQRL